MKKLLFSTVSILFALLAMKGNAQIKEAPEPEFFTKAEIDPTFKLGDDGWIQYLAKNLNNNIPYKIDGGKKKR